MIIVILGDKGYSTRMNQRTDKALSLYLSSPNKYNLIIPTGGVTRTTHKHSEGFYMKQRLIAGGVPRKKIKIESRAQNTIENAKYTKKMVQKKGVVVVTSKKHMNRVKPIFKKIYERTDIKFICS